MSAAASPPSFPLRALMSVHLDGAGDRADRRQRRWLADVTAGVEKLGADPPPPERVDVLCVQGAWGVRAGACAKPCLALGSTSFVSRLCPALRLPCSASASRMNVCVACGAACAVACGCICGGCTHDQKAFLSGSARLPHVVTAPPRSSSASRGCSPWCSSSGIGDSGLCMLASRAPDDVRFVEFDVVMARREDVVRKGALIARWGQDVVLNAHLSRDETARSAQLARVREMIPKLAKMHPGARLHMCLSAKFSRTDPPMVRFIESLKTDHGIRSALAPTQTTQDGRECDHIFTSSHAAQEDAITIPLDSSSHTLVGARFV